MIGDASPPTRPEIGTLPDNVDILRAELARQSFMQRLTSEQVFELTNQYANYSGNLINPAMFLLEGATENANQMKIYEGRAVENFLTGVTEWPFAHNIGITPYKLSFKADKNSEWGFYGHGDESVREVIARALASQQVHPAELPRYEVDKRLDELRVSMRSKGDFAPIAMFSPSLPGYAADPDIAARGYNGSGVIYISEFDDAAGTENIRGLWLPELGLESYQVLARALLATDNLPADAQERLQNMLQVDAQNCTRPDLAVLEASAAFEPEHVQIIEEFVQKHSQRHGELLPLAEAYVAQQMKPRLVAELLPQLYKVALCASKGAKPEALLALEATWDILRRYQTELRMFMRENGATGDTDLADNIHCSVSEYLRMDAQAQWLLIQQLGTQAFGCGFAAVNALQQRSAFAGGNLGGSYDRSLYEYICQNCGRVNFIDVPNGYLIEACRNCSYKVERCA